MNPDTRVVDPDAGLSKAIGLGGATLLVIGSVIGSGIFLTSGLIAAQIPSASLLLAAWIAGGVLAMAGGLTYAEMGSMYPRSGGLYVFLNEAYGPVWGFLFGWAGLLVILSGTVAAVATGFAEYFSYFVPALGTDRVLLAWTMPWGLWTLSAGQIVAASAVVVVAAVNYVGVRQGNGLQAVLTALKVAALLAVPLLALVYRRVVPAFTPVVPDIPAPWVSFGVAMIAVMWAYEGWYYVAFASGEIKDAPRTVPRALLLGTIALTIIYVTVNVAYLLALRIDEMRGVVRVAERAVTALVGPAGATLVAGTVVLSTFGCCAAAVIATSRVCFAMAVDGRFFRAAARVHPRFHTPHVAIVLTAAWAVILTLSGGYEALFTYVTFASVLFGVLGGLAIFVLRWRRPEHPRPARAWGYPIVPALFVAGMFLLVVNTLGERPVQSLTGLGLVALGLPFYFYWARRTPAG